MIERERGGEEIHFYLHVKNVYFVVAICWDELGNKKFKRRRWKTNI